ncbi:MAG: ABC transporter ATP-binding protein [Acidimicrobiales bacterium]
MTPSPSAILSARNVAKHWGNTVALADINVDLAPGVTGLLGSNGAGKTTFMSLVLGLHRRTSGTMSVLGKDPQTDGAGVRGRIGYAPEHHHLPPDVQAYDLVRHLAQLHGLPRRAATERASDALWQVGLGEERFRPIGTMSTGQRQRVKLAAAVAHDPALMLLDEPTDGLDPVQRDEMLQLIRRIGTEFGINILLSSHLLDEVERVCDSVVIIAAGRVTRSGALSTLRGQVTGLVLEVDDKVDEVAETLRTWGCAVELDGARMTITGEGNLHDFARDAVVRAGVGMRRLVDRQITLEDVFLEANET